MPCSSMMACRLAPTKDGCLWLVRLERLRAGACGGGARRLGGCTWAAHTAPCTHWLAGWLARCMLRAEHGCTRTQATMQARRTASLQNATCLPCLLVMEEGASLTSPANDTPLRALTTDEALASATPFAALAPPSPAAGDDEKHPIRAGWGCR